MFGFEYKYNTTEQIFDAIKMVIDFSAVELAILIWLVLFVSLCVLYIFPLLISIGNKRKKEKAKKKRKKLLTQISMQKEIEDEIAAEIETANQ